MDEFSGILWRNPRILLSIWNMILVDETGALVNYEFEMESS